MIDSWADRYRRLTEEGRIEAFWDLWSEVESVMVRLAFRRLRENNSSAQISDAEDVVQEVMLRARKSFEAEAPTTNLVAAFSSEEGARKYLTIMVENEIKNAARKTRRQAELDDMIGFSVDIDQQMEEDRAAKAISAIGLASARVVLSHMSPRDRTIFRTVRRGDGTQEQRYHLAGQKLGIPIPTVKKRWLRAQNEWKRIVAMRLKNAEIT